MQRFTKQFAAVVFGMWLVMMPVQAAAQDEADIRQSEQDEISFYELEEQFMVTVATKTKTTVQEAPSIVSVISSEEIADMGAENIMQVLNTVAGFDIQTDNMMAVVGVRGIVSQWGDAKVKIMIDGHSLQLLYGSVAFSNLLIPIDNVKQIEIIRGPGSALYGENAFAGVINIITKKAESPNAVSVSIGSYDAFKTSGQLNYRKDDFEFSLYGDFHDSDGSGVTVEQDAAYTSFGKDFSAAPGEIDDWRKQAHIRTFMKYKDFYYSNYYDYTECGQKYGITYSLAPAEIYNWFLLQEVGYKRQLSDKLNLSVKAYYDHVTSDNFFEFYTGKTTPLFSAMNPDSEPFPEGEGLKVETPLKLSKAGGELFLDYSLHPEITIAGGALYEYLKAFDTIAKVNTNITGRELIVEGITYQPLQYLGSFRDITDFADIHPDADRTVTAFYSQATFDIKNLFSLDNIGKGLSVTIGARYDNYDDMGSTTNPRIGIVYALNEKLYFKALYGRAFRPPSFLDMYAHNNGSYVGNPDLEPEKITTAEGMIGFDFSSSLKVLLTIFNNRTEDLITGVSTPQGGLTFLNVGKIESSGIEVELRTSFGKSLYAYLNCTFLNTEDTTNETISYTDPVTGSVKFYTQEDFKTGNFPDFMLNTGFTYGLTENIVAHVNMNYRGKRDRSGLKKFDGDGNLINADIREAADDYFLLNAALTFKDFIPSMKGVSFQLSGYNLLDQDYVLPDTTGQLADDFPMPGIHFLGKISYSF